MNAVAYRSEWVDWVNTYDWSDSYAFTFTFPQEIAENRALVMRLMKLFLNRLDVAVYRHAARRNNRRCRRVTVIEGGSYAMNNHMHGVVKTPEKFSKPMFLMMMRLNWKIITQGEYQTEPYRYQIDEIRIEDDGKTGWVSYLSKTLHPQNADAFCIETTWLK